MPSIAAPRPASIRYPANGAASPEIRTASVMAKVSSGFDQPKSRSQLSSRLAKM